MLSIIDKSSDLTQEGGYGRRKTKVQLIWSDLGSDRPSGQVEQQFNKVYTADPELVALNNVIFDNVKYK